MKIVEKIIAIIPARGGSKGISRKNVKNLINKPLLSYTIEEALKSKFIKRVFVSTDDNEIAKFAREAKAEVIKRPTELAKDNSHRRDAIKHVLNTLQNEMNYFPELIVFLQPTSPLRTVEDIENAITLYLEKDCDSVISVCESTHTPYWSLSVKNEFIVPLFGWDFLLNKMRQNLPKTYFLNGAIYITSVKDFLKNNSLFNKRSLPYLMPFERSVDIDNEFDFSLAEYLMRKRLVERE